MAFLVSLLAHLGFGARFISEHYGLGHLGFILNAAAYLPAESPEVCDQDVGDPGSGNRWFGATDSDPQNNEGEEANQRWQCMVATLTHKGMSLRLRAWQVQ
ncbi:hypothetical protein BJ085DRAFT_31168 [Dimargaris cristalligena]|uniref:Uncharacterized protein n=1 Tax=Dimargaris cristalligena TaxID=215637 RepID=A0A4P9ZSM2_9FUNG|nr:hypothetical protein BJ085DRAFT_31168 [Dimargaris cristalligena]|eukprot:RKP35811.1 hypothetical protein BJ085DRAFT_31168 [Dimargaris cristalligena]